MAWRRYRNTGLLKEVFWHAGGFCDAIPFPRVVMIPFRKRVGRIKNRKLNMKNCCIMSGEYAGGISTIQCLYAPEFVSHTEGNIVKVD
jgi:hypothetical protein